MSKKSKKRKHRRLTPCSAEEEQASKKQGETNTSTTTIGKQHVKCQESSPAKYGESGSSAIKGGTQYTRQIKKPVYRLRETQAKDQKSVNKDGDSTERKSGQTHGGKSSSKAKHVSGKNNTDSGRKAVENEPSDSMNITSAILQRKDRTSKVSVDEKSSQRSPFKLKAQLMSPRLVSAEQNDQRHNVPKKRQSDEPDSNSVQTKKPRNTSSSSASSMLKWVPVEGMCQKHEEKDYKARTNMHTHTQIPSASTTECSSTHSTVESSPKVLRKVSKTTQSSSQEQMHSFKQPLCYSFKIPKKCLPRPVASTYASKDVPSKNTNLKHETKLSDSKVSVRNVTQETVQQAHRCLTVTPSFSPDVQDKRSSLPGQLSTMSNTNIVPGDDEMQVVEELHLARSHKLLSVEVRQSYGELTCMDIDAPEESATDAPYKQAVQQVLILVLDTNILLSHLNYIKNIRSHGLRDLGFPVILIPWVVLQELDSLKERHSSHSVAHLAIPAISFIYNCLKSREPYLWGQSMQQATESIYGLNAENNDDRVLQCCLQYQSLYPECALILCTNDKNLCSKALLSGVKALSQKDLEEELGTSRDGHHFLHKLQSTMLPQTNQQVSSSVPSSSREAVQQHSQSRRQLSLGFTDKDAQQLSEDRWDLSRCVSELEATLKEVLSDVLEVEMKALYEDLWLEIVYVKPPWSLQDVLQCLKKHWIAVFGFIVPRSMHQTVLNLIHFFNPGCKKTVDVSATLKVLTEAMDLVKAFGNRSSRAASGVSQMDNILNKLQLRRYSPAADVIMTDDEDKQPKSAHVSHQEVWVLFENIWSTVYQVSLEVFKALGFDPHTMQCAHPVRDPSPPQEALACLHKLSSMVSQLLQAFSSVLSSASGLEEVQTLLGVILSSKIVPGDCRLTARDLLDCFSHQEYREKLRVGGSQLVELKETLDRCAEATGHSVALTTCL